MKLETFFENFEHLAAAPNGVRKLRELILQLAMQGKLTQTLRSVGAISKEESWKTVDFFNFCILQRGYDLPLSKQEEGKFPIVTSAGIAAYHSEFKAKAPGVIVGRSGSIGKVFYIEEDFWPHNTALYVKDFKGNFPRYVYYYLLGFKAQQFSRSTAVPTLNRNHLRGLMVEVPPYEEQKQIVIKIEELMALCDELEERQRRQQAARARLNNAALDRMLTARAPEEFVAHWQRICDNFDLLYDAPETVGQLRQAVLQLAVQGKLVSQDPNDEPASALLEKIRAEKERLVKEKKIKKSDPLPPIEPDEAPFDLPKGWGWARFPELGEFGRGKSKHRPRNDPKLYKDGQYRIVQTGDVARANKVIQTHTGLYNEVGLSQSRMWPKGTLCITIAANIADSGILGFDACIPDSVVGLIPSIEIGDASYFEYFMRTAKSRLLDYAPSTAQKNINLGILETVLIPLPPLNEIRRIVAKVDQLMALCDDLEARLKAAQAASGKLMDATVKQLLTQSKTRGAAA